MNTPILIEVGTVVSLKKGTRFYSEKVEDNQFMIFQIAERQRYRKGFGGVETYKVYIAMGNGAMRKLHHDEIESVISSPQKESEKI